MKQYCDNIGSRGIWSDDTQSCIVGYDDQTSHAEAEMKCQNEAKGKSAGRLAFIGSEKLATAVSGTYGSMPGAGAHRWIGASTHGAGKGLSLIHFKWTDPEFCFNRSYIFQTYLDKAPALSDGCMEYDELNDNFAGVNCNETKKRFCEFYIPPAIKISCVCKLKPVIPYELRFFKALHVGKKPDDDGYLDTVDKVGNAGICIIHCYNYYRCAGIAYDSQAKSCILHMGTGGLLDSPDHIMYGSGVTKEFCELID